MQRIYPGGRSKIQPDSQNDSNSQQVRLKSHLLCIFPSIAVEEKGGSKTSRLYALDMQIWVTQFVRQSAFWGDIVPFGQRADWFLTYESSILI